MALIISLKITIYYVKKWNEYIFICNLSFFYYATIGSYIHWENNKHNSA